MSEQEVLNPETLPPDAQEIIRTKKIRARKRLSRWLVLLRVLSQFDSVTDDAYSKAVSKLISSGVLIFICFFFLVFGLGITEGSLIIVAIGVPVTLFGIVRAIVYGIKASRLNKNDLSNDFRETLLPLLEILSEDIPSKGKILLDLNFDDGTDKVYKTSEKKLPPGRFKKLIEKKFNIHCCSASVPLVNDTVLQLDIEKEFASYDRHYTNPRGKTKHKRKWKLLTVVTAAVVPAGEDFMINDEKVSDLAVKEKIKLREKKGEKVCRLTRKFKFKSPDGSVPEGCVPSEAVIEMYMKLCSTLNAAT